MENNIKYLSDITYKAELTPHHFLQKGWRLRFRSESGDNRRFYLKRFIKKWWGVKFAQQLMFTIVP